MLRHLDDPAGVRLGSNRMQGKEIIVKHSVAPCQTPAHFPF